MMGEGGDFMKKLSCKHELPRKLTRTNTAEKKFHARPVNRAKHVTWRKIIMHTRVPKKKSTTHKGQEKKCA